MRSGTFIVTRLGNTLGGAVLLASAVLIITVGQGRTAVGHVRTNAALDSLNTSSTRTREQQIMPKLVLALRGKYRQGRQGRNEAAE